MNYPTRKCLTGGLLIVLGVALGCSRPPGGPHSSPPPDTEAVVQGSNRFALELYARLRKREGNLCLSPFSISAALAMTSAGARGSTLDQMASTLHFPEQEKLHPAMAALLQEVNGPGEGRSYRLSTANALWGQKGYRFRPEFLALTEKHYGAGLHEVDFRAAVEQARRTINAWVEKETQDKIKELFKPGVLTTDDRLVLTNAIYFKGDWASPFPREHTREEPFTRADGTQVRVPLMSQVAPFRFRPGKADDPAVQGVFESTFRYLDGGTFQALEMPYAGEDLALVVLLPRKADGLAGLEEGLTATRLAGWLGQMRPKEVRVVLPRFRVTTEVSLAKELSALGMPLAFGDSADFSGLKGGAEALALSVVVHQAFVEVNEEGTEAAGATGSVAGSTVPQFQADHPFVFLIRDRRSGSILFLGRLMDPK